VKVVGRSDIVNFPAMGLVNVPVKVDTGAYTSSIHCSKIEIKDQALHCTFKIGRNKHSAIFTEFTTKKVKSSNGIAEERYLIKSNVKMSNRIYKIGLTLSKRTGMKYPVLLGRKFLNKKFIVDVSKKNLSYKSQKRK